MPSYDKPLTMLFGPTTVRVKRYGSSVLALAGILGVECDESGRILRLYLDRLIHTRADVAPDGWTLSGAITTVLTPPAGFSLPAQPDDIDCAGAATGSPSASRARR